MINKILIVDDNSNNLRLLSDILVDEGYDVYTTENSLSVQELTHKLKPDVILLDIMMPELDGYEVCKLLKNDFEIKEIPIIMVTAKTDGNDLKYAFDLGAIDYIKKPFDEVEVVARVQSAIRLKLNQENLKEKATKDGLTGLYNRTLLIELYEKELKNQSRNQEYISFVMLDIDFFKKINDTHGHVNGDKVLRELASLLNNSVRSHDYVGRYGGEEFSIVLTKTDMIDTNAVCERIRKTIEEYQFIADDLVIPVTVSIGYYCKSPLDNTDLLNTIKKADEALYLAKQSGRNRVESYKLMN